jgi:hypothetical protein
VVQLNRNPGDLDPVPGGLDPIVFSFDHAVGAIIVGLAAAVAPASVI